MRLLLLTFFALCPLFGGAQEFYPPIVNYSTHDYGKDRNPEAFQIVQDKRGVIYFSTGSGIVEYDGTKWQFIKIGQGSFVRSLAVDERGVVYAGTYNDFGYLAPDKWGELKFNSLKERLSEEDQFFSDIWNIYANETSVYFQAQESFFEYDISEDKLWTIYPENSYHTSFMVDGTLYLRERNVGIVKYVNDDLVKLEGTEEFEIYGCFGIHHLEDDSLLIISQEIGLFKWKDGQMRSLPELNDEPLSELGIFGSKALGDGRFALNTFAEGVIIIDEKGKIVTKIDRTKGARSNHVQGMFMDRDLNLWLALGNGVSKVNYHSPLSYFNEKMGVEGDVQAIIRFKGMLYVGTSYGLFVQVLEDPNSKVFRNTNAVKGQVWDFKVVDDVLYVATWGGVYRSSDGQKFTKLTDRNANVITYMPDQKHFVVGGSEGIFIYGHDFFEAWAYPNNFSTFLGAELDPNYENTLWMGTSNSGIMRMQWTGEEYLFDQYGFMDGMIDDELGKPIIYNDSVIFGSTQGLMTFIHESEIVKELPDSLKNDPEFNRGIFQTQPLYDSIFTTYMLLIEDDANRTWYCSDFKVGYYNKKTKEYVNQPFYGLDYGRINEFYLEDDGVLWIGSADGLIRYKQNDYKRYDSDFYTLIRKFQAGRDSVVFNGAWMDAKGNPIISQPETEEIMIDYVNNDAHFWFSAPYFEDGHKLLYSHILEGVDDDHEWTQWSNKTEVSFTNLMEGDYVFRVRAKNIYEEISEEAVYRFTILPPWYRTSWAYMLYAVGFLLILFIGVRISSIRLKAKNAWLEGVVEKRTKEIIQKNIVLQHQKQEIEDSINYAQRIQNAILPLETEMKKWIPKSFVLFRPKDIVSGDFYWFLEKNRKLVFVCADCTGHGVPGAFMSMIGSDRLNIIVSERKITSPGKILSELNVAIKTSLKQDGEVGSSRDGMDAAICTIDLDTNMLYYAGANRPLWIIEDGEIQEIKATKVAVAGFTSDDQVYEEHAIPLSEGLKFYMTSDGYADQFGGAREKKYKVKAMKEFILANCGVPFDQQRDKLEQEIVEWMGDIEQIDDICVVGFEP